MKRTKKKNSELIQKGLTKKISQVVSTLTHSEDIALRNQLKTKNVWEANPKETQRKDVKPWLNRLKKAISMKAPLIVGNLAEPASKTEVKKVEQTFHVHVPDTLKSLWSIHNGQKEEGNGLFESLDFLSTQEALCESPRANNVFKEYFRSNNCTNQGFLSEEEQNPTLIVFAARDRDFLAIHCWSGRVFDIMKDWPPLSLRAYSLPSFLENYTKEIEAGLYSVEEGFGDYYFQSANHDRCRWVTHQVIIAEQRITDLKEVETEEENGQDLETTTRKIREIEAKALRKLGV